MCDMTHPYVWHDSFMWHQLEAQGVIAIFTCVWHDSFMCVTWLIHMSDMTHLYEWHDSSIWVTRLIFTCNMTHSHVWHDSFTCVWHDSFTCVTWLIHPNDMTHAHVWHESFMCDMAIHMESFMCDMAHSYGSNWWHTACSQLSAHSGGWHDSFLWVTWLNLMCDMTHPYMWPTPLLFETRRIHRCDATLLLVTQWRHIHCRPHSYIHTSFMYTPHSCSCLHEWGTANCR